ncbi:hypothetical protein [uncultured Clostridium sp.]|uniref:hypothetical protein n=1 Tax=uncultured Clostridium sp. TaxID=59620 RepID=UPI0025DE61C7|nr:hypothetical protein [uncultured Clostridium sp.]
MTKPSIIDKSEDLTNKMKLIKKQISLYEKEISLLQIKKRFFPPSKHLYKFIEVTNWLLTIISIIYWLRFVPSSYNTTGNYLRLLITSSPFLFLAIIFRDCYNRCINNENYLSLLQIKLLELNDLLEKVKKDQVELLFSKESTDEDFKECPVCLELVRSKAKICRYCGHKF